MKFTLALILILFSTFPCISQVKNPRLLHHSLNATIDEETPENDEESERGFTFSVDLGMYLASKKTANLHNGIGLSATNSQAVWYSIPDRLGINPNVQTQVTQVINDQYPEYNGTVTGYSLDAASYPTDMNYSPKIFFGINATYHLNKYWGIMAKSSLANIKSTAVYTMVLEGPTIPQNATEVIQQFDLTGEEQRVHFDLGFKNTSYNDYGFKWFWGGGISLVGAKIESNTAFIGKQRYELILQNNGNTQFLTDFNAAQTNFNVGYFLNTGWEMEYKERYDFGIGFHISRDPIELGLVKEDVFNKRIYIYFGI